MKKATFAKFNAIIIYSPMFILILFLATGSVLAYLSKNNFTPVDLSFGPYALTHIPVFYVIVASLLVGLSLSYAIHLISSFKTYLSLKNKDATIKKDQDEILELTKRVHQLELEIQDLRETTGLNPDDPKSL